MIISIRGTNGSGKSTLVRHLMSCCTIETLKGYFGVEGYHLKEINTRVIGSYEAPTGGCDTITTGFPVISERVLRYSKQGHVVFEGFQLTYQLWLDFSRANGGMTWAFLDTPLEVCLQRVKQRTGDKALQKNNIKNKHRQFYLQQVHAQEAGEKVVILPYQDPFPVLNSLLTSETLTPRSFVQKIQRRLL